MDLIPATEIWKILMSLDSGCRETPESPGGRSETRDMDSKVGEKVIKM